MNLKPVFGQMHSSGYLQKLKEEQRFYRLKRVGKKFFGLVLVRGIKRTCMQGKFEGLFLSLEGVGDD
jgi:hypothetical protein